MAIKTMTDAARFASRVGPPDANGCWPWLLTLDPDGYGRFHVGSRTDGSRKPLRAARFAYEQVHGPISDPALVIDHLCRNRRCVNPSHLELVSVRTNTLRGNTAQARNIAKTHCAGGHPFDETNTLNYRRKRPTGVYIERRCRTCNRVAMAEHRKAQR